MEEYKLAKEHFVSNLTGSSFWEVIYVLSVAPLAALFYRLTLTALRVHSASPESSLFYFLYSFATQVVPLMMAFLSFHTLWAYGFMVSTCVVLTLWARTRSKPFFAFSAPPRVSLENFAPSSKGFLTTFRGYLTMGTCFAVLAVDFPIFPRDHAKTESIGISLMDIGVGTFVLSHALTFRIEDYSSFFSRLVPTVPMFVLGFIRLAMVKASGYQEHVTEYGMHWNFFFTLAFVSVFMTLIIFLGGDFLSGSSPIWGIVIILLHQLALSIRVGAWVENPRGDEWYEQNKEGISSLLGYLALALLAISLGERLRTVSNNIYAWWNAAAWLLGEAVIFIALTPLVNIFLPISRKQVNITYVMAVWALSTFTLAAMMFVDLFIRAPHSVPRRREATRPPAQVRRDSSMDYGLANAFSRNQLFMFLLANLMTGGINFCVQTIYASNWLAWGVLLGYMLTLSASAFFLDYLDITLRLRLG